MPPTPNSNSNSNSNSNTSSSSPNSERNHLPTHHLTSTNTHRNTPVDTDPPITCNPEDLPPNQRPFPLEIDQRLTDELNSRINRIYRRPDGKLVPEVDNPAVAASLARARSWKPNPNERRTQSFDQQDWKHEMTMKYLEGIVPGKTPGYTETKVEKKE